MILIHCNTISSTSLYTPSHHHEHITPSHLHENRLPPNKYRKRLGPLHFLRRFEHVRPIIFELIDRIFNVGHGAVGGVVLGWSREIWVETDGKFFD